MHRAFVVKLGPKTDSTLGRLEGRAEEVDTGDELIFRSADELVRFLADRFDEALRRKQEEDSTKH